MGNRGGVPSRSRFGYTLESHVYVAHLSAWVLAMRVRNLLLWKLYRSNGTEGESRLAEVHIQDGETLESALRRFKRKVLQEEIIREIKRHSSYLKPGEKKRVKAALARKRNRKKRSRDSAMEPSR
jgi:small subunit ribosomal protein S21